MSQASSEVPVMNPNTRMRLDCHAPLVPAKAFRGEAESRSL